MTDFQIYFATVIGLSFIGILNPRAAFAGFFGGLLTYSLLSGVFR